MGQIYATNAPKEQKLSATGERIRRMREDRRLTIVDVGRACQCSQGFIMEVERGDLLPSLPMIHRLARVLDVEPSWLQHGTT